MPLRPPSPGIQPLRQIRVDRLVAQHELAAKIGTDQSTLSRLETGYIIPTPEQLAKLARVLKVKPTALFTRFILEECERRAKAASGK